AETVLIHLLVGGDVPQPAIVRADLVGQHDAHIVVFPQPAELQLEVHQLDASAQEKPGQEVVDPDGQVDHVVQVLGAGPAEGGDVFFADPGIVQPVILVIIFDDGAGQGGAFLDPEPLG